MTLLKNKISAIIILYFFIAGISIIPQFDIKESHVRAESIRTVINLIDEGFEGGNVPAEWENTGWVINYYGFPHTGSYFASNAFGGSYMTTTTENFGENTELSFWYTTDQGHPTEIEPVDLEVYIDDYTNPDNLIWSDYDFSFETYEQAIIDLSSYSGSHNITFYYPTSTQLSNGNIDDIILSSDIDITPPTITNVDAQPPVQNQGGSVEITCDVTDNEGVDSVYVNITYPDSTTSSDIMAGSGSYSFSQNYNQIGPHFFNIYTIDFNGNINESSENSFEITSDNCVDLSLGTQFNMITVSVDKPGWNASDLQNNITGCSLVARLDAQNQELEFYTGSTNTDFVLQNGEGYLVFLNQESIFSVCGPSISTVSVSLQPGFNMIGWYHEEDTTARSLLENITGCSLVGKLNVTNQAFDFYTGSPTTDFTVTQGMGLFIFVNTASVWQGEG